MFRVCWISLSRLCVLFVLPAIVAAGDWHSFQMGPFQVLSENEGDGREAMNHLEQLRHAMSGMLGKQELQSTWPIRIVIAKRQARPNLKLGRDAYVAGVTSLGPVTLHDVAAVLIDANTGYFPPDLRRGLAALLSTIEVKATRVKLGTPPAQKDRDWARAHMLSVDPSYSGKLRVLLGNLEKGIDTEVAYRNAFEKTPAEIEEALDKYVLAGQYASIPVSGKPLDPKRQILSKEMEDIAGAVALADLEVAADPHSARSNYESLLNKDSKLVAAHEGLGLAGAKEHLETAAALGSSNARVYFALGQFAKAAELNKRWPDPLLMQAQQEAEPTRKIPLLKAAVQLDPRDLGTWMALAAAQEHAGQFKDSAKAWMAAERAASDPAEKTRIRQARAASEQRRIDKAYADKEAARRKSEQEIADLRNKALAEIRAFEARANSGQQPLDSKVEIVEWDDVHKPPVKLSGVLTRVDCLGSQLRLHVTSNKKSQQFLVREPGKLIVSGGQRSLRCGPQRPAAAVTIEHEDGNPKSIEFR